MKMYCCRFVKLIASLFGTSVIQVLRMPVIALLMDKVIKYANDLLKI